MIHDIMHKMKERKQGTMSIVKCTVELMTTAHKKMESINNYYKLFVARKDTDNAHYGQAVHHTRM